jgi:signal transduction histidine kinase
MLNTLMDISEAESGTMPLNREAVRLADVAARAVDLYHDVAEAKGITLVARPLGGNESADEVRVYADRTRLEQVAANLTDNAIKYSPTGGDVVLETGTDHGDAVLRVIDRGAGIPSSELPRIWDRLFRGDRSRAERGLGLGLSLVKAIVEAHGGRVGVSSEPGRGSVFEARFRKS